MTTKKHRWTQTAFRGLKASKRPAKKILLILWMALFLLLPISFSFGSNGMEPDASQSAAESAMDREMAELVKLYRLCLQKHEDNPMKAKENCSMYKEAIREFSPTNLRSFVAELLDGLREDCDKGRNR